MSVLSRLVVLLEADIGGFEGDMGKAVRVAEQKTKQIERTAKGAGKSVSEIGHALAAANFGGLDKLADGSKVATSAIKGLGAAISLIGYASWPIAAIVAAAGALAYFVTSSKDAEEQTRKLSDSIAELSKTAQQRELERLYKILFDAETGDGTSKRILDLQSKLADLRSQLRLAIDTPGLANQLGIDPQAVKVQIAGVLDELEKWKKKEQDVGDAIARVRQESADKSEDAGAQMLANLQQQVALFGKGSEAAAQYALDHGLLADMQKKDADSAQTLAAAILSQARALDKLNKSKQDGLEKDRQQKEFYKDLFAFYDEGDQIIRDQDEAQQRLGESIDQYVNPALYEYKQRMAEVERFLVAFPERADEAAAAAKRAGDEYEKAMSKGATNAFARRAAENIQDITASLIKGEQTGRSFFQTMLNGLRDIAAELAAQQLLRALFSGFQGSGGILGAFADAVLKPRAEGGPVEAGKPYLVGDRIDRMPEVFVPATSGSIQPLPSGGGATFNVAIDASDSTDPLAVYANVSRALQEFEKRLARQIQRGQLVPSGG